MGGKSWHLLCSTHPILVPPTACVFDHLVPAVHLDGLKASSEQHSAPGWMKWGHGQFEAERLRRTTKPMEPSSSPSWVWVSIRIHVFWRICSFPLSCLHKDHRVCSIFHLEGVFIFKMLTLEHPSHRVAVGGEMGRPDRTLQDTWKAAIAFRARMEILITNLWP